MDKLDINRLKRVVRGTCWDLGNEVLYRLCREYPKHDDEEEILAKIWLVGRSYSAAIERRPKSSSVNGEDFYKDVVGPMMRKAKIDQWLRPLAQYEKPAFDNSSLVIGAHKKLTDLFVEITGLSKRSLASKYLHFHFPKLFYLYDSRAAKAARSILPRVRQIPPFEKSDAAYAAHYLRCMELVKGIEQDCGIYLNPRRLDDYLLRFS